jgi:hypothetical protein
MDFKFYNTLIPQHLHLIVVDMQDVSVFHNQRLRGDFFSGNSLRNIAPLRVQPKELVLDLHQNARIFNFINSYLRA